jgi:hypothetical protein
MRLSASMMVRLTSRSESPGADSRAGTAEILPLSLMAQQKGYQVEIVVWATTPAGSALLRAMNLASEL